MCDREVWVQHVHQACSADQVIHTTTRITLYYTIYRLPSIRFVDYLLTDVAP